MNPHRLSLFAVLLCLTAFVHSASAAKPVITSPETAKGAVAVAFKYQITASGSPTSYSASLLPKGLSVNTTTGLISGKVATAGAYAITVTARNSAGSGVAAVKIIIRVPTVTAHIQTGMTFPILCDGKGRTIYTYDPDVTLTSSSPNFPDVTPWHWVVISRAPVAGPGVTPHLGSKMKDGKRVLTVRGLPAYYYSGDTVRGDANGRNLPSWGAFSATGHPL